MRFLIPILAALMVSSAPQVAAADSDLILPSTGTDALFSVLDPGLGMIQVYHQDTQLNTWRGSHHTVGFLESSEREIAKTIGENSYSLLRVGSGGWGSDPTTAIEPLLLKIEEILTPTVTVRNAVPGAQPQAVRLRDMEHAWWNAEHPYDGKLCAGVSGENGKYLLVGVPSKRALVLYDTTTFQNRRSAFEPASVRGMGPEMYVPLVFGDSEPSSNDVLTWAKSAIAKRFVDPETRKRRVEAAEQLLNGLSAGPGVAPAAAPVAALPAPDLWIGGLTTGQSSGTFVVFDSVGRRIYLYRAEGNRITLKAVRNLGLDLAANSIAGENIGSVQLETVELQTLLKDTTLMQMASQFRLIGLPAEAREHLESLRSQLNELLSTQRRSVSGSGIVAKVINSDQVAINLVNERRLVVFDTSNGNNLKLVSLRDYSIDQATAVLTQTLNDKRRAVERSQSGAGAIAAFPPAGAKPRIEALLKVEPMLYASIDANPTFAKFKAEPWWQPMISAAQAKAQAIEAQFQERIKPRK